jgi:hypothetical protein
MIYKPRIGDSFLRSTKIPRQTTGSSKGLAREPMWEVLSAVFKSNGTGHRCVDQIREKVHERMCMFYRFYMKSIIACPVTISAMVYKPPDFRTFPFSTCLLAQLRRIKKALDVGILFHVSER